jgi:hypothetical protein
MHRVTYCIREILAAELPTITDVEGITRPATEAELLNLGVHSLGHDLFECVSQERRDPDTFAWALHDEPHAGLVIAEGSHRCRYGSVPAEHAPKVFRAQVIRSTDPAEPAATVAQANVAEAEAALAEYVGDVAGAPLVDLAGPSAALEEAQRLVAMPNNGIERHVVPMISVDPGDVVEAQGLVPHRWQGESAF